MNAAVAGDHPVVTSAVGEIRLRARHAQVSGTHLRYESEPYKDTLGYWVNAADSARWEFSVPHSGQYEVEVWQGCGTGSGKAEVTVSVEEQHLPFIVLETGHFQNFIQRTIGILSLAAGPHTLRVAAQSKPGVAVMDLRQVVLRPLK